MLDLLHAPIFDASARSRDHFYLPASAQNSEASEEPLKAEESRLICRKQLLLISEDINRTEFTVFYF